MSKARITNIAFSTAFGWLVGSIVYMIVGGENEWFLLWLLIVCTLTSFITDYFMRRSGR